MNCYCHFRPQIVRCFGQNVRSYIPLCCRPPLVRCTVAIIAVGTDMIISNICKFFHRPVHLFLCPEFIQVRTFILQRVEVPFHRRIIIRIPRLAHALSDAHAFTELHKCPGCVLAPLITMQNQSPFALRVGIKRFLHSAYGQVTGDVPACYAGDYASVIKIYDCAVISHVPILQKQVCEIRTPFLIGPVGGKILSQPVLEYFVRFPRPGSRLSGAHNGTQPQFSVHISMDGDRAIVVPSTFQIDRHAAVTVNAVMIVIYFGNLFQHFRLTCIKSSLSVFAVVIVSIWADRQTAQQPADAEKIPVFINKPISL